MIDNTINPTLHGSITSIGTNLYTVAADPGYTTTLITVTDNTTGDVTHPAAPIVDLRAASHASTISATFTPTVTASTISFNGSISPFGATAVAEAASQVYTITPFPNYHVSSVMVGATVATATEIRGSCTINSGVATCTVYGAATPQIIQASFAGNINVSKTGNGNISNAGLVYTFNADFGNHVAEVKVDGAVVAGAPSSYTFADAAPHTLAVTFAVDIVPTIMSVSVVPNNGTITIDNVTHIATITPFESYYIEKVTVDGTDLPTAVSSYDFSGLAAGAHTITATFTAL